MERGEEVRNLKKPLPLIPSPNGEGGGGEKLKDLTP